jgi:hypothetical protein
MAPVSNLRETPTYMDHLACFTPADLAGRSPPDLGAFRWKLLAQGDSWFSNAAAKLNAHANLLQELVFKDKVAAVNCAGTGNALSHMVDLESSPDFVRLLTGPEAPVWDGVLLSMGGNDLIAAARTPAQTWNGEAIPAAIGRRRALFLGARLGHLCRLPARQRQAPAVLA